MSAENRSYSDFTVLFVDDEINILSSLRRGLLDEEYQMIFASSGLEALDILSKKNISVIVSDMKMPGMDGLTLLKEVRRLYPKTVRIVLSGYTQLQQVLATVNQADIFKFITKPWKLEDEFTLIIRQALDYHILQLERDEFERALLQKNQAYQNILKRIEDVVESSKEDKEMIVITGNEILRNVKAAADAQGSLLIRNKLTAGMEVFNGISLAGYGDKKKHRIAELLVYINDFAEQQKNILSFEIDSDMKEDFTFSTGIELIEAVIRLSITTFTSNADRNIMKVILRKEVGQEKTGFSVSVLIMNKSEPVPAEFREAVDKNTDSLMDMFNKVFDKILKISGGAYSCARSEQNVVLKVVVVS